MSKTIDPSDLVGRTLADVVDALKLKRWKRVSRSESGSLATNSVSEPIVSDDSYTVAAIEPVRGWGDWRYRIFVGDEYSLGGLAGNYFVK